MFKHLEAKNAFCLRYFRGIYVFLNVSFHKFKLNYCLKINANQSFWLYRMVFAQ